MSIDKTDPWRPFGEPQWREFQEACQASDLQLKFAVARFNGASAAESARISGYAGDHDAIRRAGYQALRTSAVVALLDMAAVHSPAESKLTEAEVDSRLAKLVRSPDPLVMLEATELYDKRKQRAKEAGESRTDDGLSDWRTARDMLCQQNGATRFLLYFKAKEKSMGHPANLPLLHDVWSTAQNEPFGNQVWDWCCQSMVPQMRECLAERLANPNWQRDKRIQIWKEIHVDISKVMQPAN